MVGRRELKQRRLGLSESLKITITSMVSHEDLPGTDLEYVVRNDMDSAIWLVNDGWLTWRQMGPEIELSYARGRMRTGAQVFGYFPPDTVKIPPGEQLTRTIHLKWPQALDRLWNTASEANPAPGKYRVSVRIGYGATPGPEPPRSGEGVEEPVLRWQQEAVSESAMMTVFGSNS
jgi:hypothetical protein